ncbi:MAG: hypothetical protein RL095_2041 [Verrucomicrobiota bacterium]|jgi:hypothetical protein
MPLKPAFLTLLLIGLSAAAQESAEARLERMEVQMKKMQEQLEKRDGEVEQLRDQVKEMETRQAETAEAVSQYQRGEAQRLSLGGGPLVGLKKAADGLRFSLSTSIVGGASTATDSQLEELNAGGHDPKRRGFTLQGVELGIGGELGGLFDSQANVVFLEDEIELEEAYVKTREMPADLQLKMGYYYTEFGYSNTRHPHNWTFIDRGLVVSRLLGADGMRAVGAQLSWLAPVDWYSEFIVGLQNSGGDHTASFRGAGHVHDDEEHAEHGFEEGVGGYPYHSRETRDLGDTLLSGRWVNAGQLDSLGAEAQLGLSGALGKNHSGGLTALSGVDLVMKWEGESLQRPAWIWQSEIMQRHYRGDGFSGEDENGDPISLGSDTLRDWGAYSEVVHSLDNTWGIGLRGEVLRGSGDSYEEAEAYSRNQDPSRDNRVRISPLLDYHFNEQTRLRLQYNYDRAAHLDSPAHSVWLGFDMTLGSHPAHRF